MIAVDRLPVGRQQKWLCDLLARVCSSSVAFVLHCNGLLCHTSLSVVVLNCCSGSWKKDRCNAVSSGALIVYEPRGCCGPWLLRLMQQKR